MRSKTIRFFASGLLLAGCLALPLTGTTQEEGEAAHEAGEGEGTPTTTPDAALQMALADPVVSGAVAGFESLHTGLVRIGQTADVTLQTYEDGATYEHVSAFLTYNSPQGADVWGIQIEGNIGGGTFWVNSIIVSAAE